MSDDNGDNKLKRSPSNRSVNSNASASSNDSNGSNSSKKSFKKTIGGWFIKLKRSHSNPELNSGNHSSSLNRGLERSASNPEIVSKSMVLDDYMLDTKLKKMLSQDEYAKLVAIQMPESQLGEAKNMVWQLVNRVIIQPPSSQEHDADAVAMQELHKLLYNLQQQQSIEQQQGGQQSRGQQGTAAHDALNLDEILNGGGASVGEPEQQTSPYLNIGSNGRVSFDVKKDDSKGAKTPDSTPNVAIPGNEEKTR